MKAHRRPVSGCGSQRMLHALERRSHSADHGPSLASLYSPFVAMRHLPPTGGSLCSLAAVSSAAIPVRVKLKTPLRNAAAATTLDIPSRWDPRTKQQPTGLIAYPAAQGRAVRFPCGLHETATTLDIPTGWDPNTKKEPTGLFFAACGRPCSFDSSYGLHEKIPDPKIRDFIHDPYGNRTHVTAVKGPCLNRLTNGP